MLLCLHHCFNFNVFTLSIYHCYCGGPCTIILPRDSHCAFMSHALMLTSLLTSTFSHWAFITAIVGVFAPLFWHVLRTVHSRHMLLCLCHCFNFNVFTLGIYHCHCGGACTIVLACDSHCTFISHALMLTSLLTSTFSHWAFITAVGGVFAPLFWHVLHMAHSRHMFSRLRHC